MIPSLYLIVWTFGGTEIVGVLSDSPTMKWILNVITSRDWIYSLGLSSLLAAGVSFLTACLLCVHFYLLRYVALIVEQLTYFLVVLPVIIPSVIYALALRLFGGAFGLGELLLLFMGHMVFVIPIQYFVFEAAQDDISSTTLFAGSTLGASHLSNIYYVYFPQIRRTFISSFFVGFFFSFDEIVIATFVIDSPLVTVPKRLWDGIHRSMDPVPAVIATILLTSYFVGLAIIALITSHDSGRFQRSIFRSK
ncbi:putrescine transporter subunit: membrane component of ABC superfamily protein [Gimesia alba]|uniref:Putrescine transporter subunit: membrane component of ABC superfamily protein n=1 Tax=Gimesia alba TaxID=2527973 RepID=A0A517RHX5_9PLAN|nr:hypothetical protein [Gimesia alba]QDT43476.1 putrescine transporter subunit: membrane component of ABC superfamily protein [Gimesia alba]